MVLAGNWPMVKAEMDGYSMKHLYLMRHGETLFNRRQLIQGVVNSPLMAEGVAQALHTKQAYFEKNQVIFDHVYTSPEGRAIETTELITDQPYVLKKGLHEMCFGRLEGCPVYLGCPKSQFDTYYGTIGGETTAQVQERMNKTLLEIMNDPANTSVLAVAHGCANSAFAAYWEKYNQIPGNDMLYNCSVLHYQFDPDKQIFVLVEIFDENYHTEDLQAALATGMAFSFPEITENDF